MAALNSTTALIAAMVELASAHFLRGLRQPGRPAAGGTQCVHDCSAGADPKGNYENAGGEQVGQQICRRGRQAHQYRLDPEQLAGAGTSDRVGALEDKTDSKKVELPINEADRAVLALLAKRLSTGEASNDDPAVGDV